MGDRRDGDRLNGIVDAIFETWPNLTVDRARFVEHLTGRIDPALDDPSAVADAVEALDTDGLFLAFAAGEGVDGAIATIEQAYFGDVRRAVSKFSADIRADEIEQRLRAKLFVPVGDERSKILGYSGHGELGRWLKVVATREALAIVRKGKRETLTDDAALMDAVTPSRDQELDYLKSHYRAGFKVAFHKALDELEPRQRTILRYQLVDGLNIDDIGAVYGVHRATVARWIEKIRATLLKKTRNTLMEEIRVGTDELDSIMRLIQSQLDVSLHRILSEKVDA